MKRVVCLLIVGEKHNRLFKKHQQQFLDYAKKCGADFKIIDQAPDPAFKKPLFSQKMLIPGLLLDYDEALFLDTDIAISPDAPCIFDDFPADKDFAAVTDPRGSKEYRTAWGYDERILNETTASYFTERNFEYSDKFIGTINGGVLLFRPAALNDLFREYYFSDHSQGEFTAFEEAPMAHLTQVRDKFHSLDPRFNAQVFYRLKGTPEGIEIFNNEHKVPEWWRKRYYKKTGAVFYPTSAYRKMIRREYKKNFFLHFAGGFPMPSKI